MSNGTCYRYSFFYVNAGFVTSLADDVFDYFQIFGSDECIGILPMVDGTPVRPGGVGRGLSSSRMGEGHGSVFPFAFFRGNDFPTINSGTHGLMVFVQDYLLQNAIPAIVFSELWKEGYP